MPFQVVPHVRAKLHFAVAVCIVDASGSKGIHVDDIFGLHSFPTVSYVQLSGHFDIKVGFSVITTCGFIISLYATRKRTVNTIVNATVLTYSILSLIQGKEWILLDMY
jgi:hypothetical protein